ncbi:MAG: hypothetical protein MUO97_03790, partial [Dehalococcoidia bacterium]|nr:hypothetical protein [Dehalococcoidia bacterium]
MSKKITEGWYSPLYSLAVAKQWANALWATYPRASELLMDICGKGVRDVWYLAQKSQRGWENWKYAVKNIESQYC